MDLIIEVFQDNHGIMEAKGGVIPMADIALEVERYEKKIRNCETMTDLLLTMSAWQNYARGLTEEQRRPVDLAYIEVEARLLKTVSKTPW